MPFAAMVAMMSVSALLFRSTSFANRPGPSKRMMPFDTAITLSGMACMTIQLICVISS